MGLLALADTNSTSSTTSSLGMLTTHTESVVVTDTTMAAHLLQTLEIFTKLVIQVVDQKMVIFSVTNILLSIQHPKGDVVFERVLDHIDNTFELVFLQLTGTFLDIDVCALACKEGKSTTNTFDVGDGKGNLLPTVDVGVHQTNDVLEAFLVGTN